MKEYEYLHDNQNFEIFPEEIWKNPLIVFHGTVEFHSEKIERNGFVVNTAPYEIEHVKTLIELLKSEEFSKYDFKKGFFNWTTAHSIGHYVESIERNDFRLSFSNLSSACVQFTQAEKKGGQAFRDIREAKRIIDEVINTESKLINLIPEEVNELFEKINKIEQTRGVVYAVKLPADLHGIMCENNIIYSDLSIPKESIVAKVVIPDNPQELHINTALLNQKIMSKLQSQNGLGVILYRKQYYE